jgi:hypothetical protein
MYLAGTSENLLRVQSSRLWCICVNQRFALGKGSLLGANSARSRRFSEFPRRKSPYSAGFLTPNRLKNAVE